MRGLAFAVEADRLLRQGTSAPTGTQLAEADEARRARNSELNAALARLSTRVGSGPRGTGARWFGLPPSATEERAGGPIPRSESGARR